MAVDKVKIICGSCQKEFYVLPCHSKRKYCSNKCVGIANKGRLAGDKNPSKRPEVKKKMSKAQTKRYSKTRNYCKSCNKKIKSESKRCKKCWSKWNTGKNHHAWKPEKKKKIRKSDLEKGYSTLFNKTFKLSIFERDGFQCQLCEKKGGTLHCHHIDYNKRNNDRKNFVTLCNSCHAKTNHNREFWKKHFNHQHKKYSLVIGRFQCLPPHEGHIGIIRQLLADGQNVCVAMRRYDGEESDPFSYFERLKEFEYIFQKEIEDGRVIVIDIPNVTEVVYGRKPGWKIKEITLSEEVQKISGTEQRKVGKQPLQPDFELIDIEELEW